MFSSQDAKELVATQSVGGVCALLSFGFGCALLYVVLFVESNDKFGLDAFCCGTPLAFALIWCLAAGAVLSFEVSIQIYERGVAIPLSLLAVVPGIGLVVAVVLARKTAALLRSPDLQAGRCAVCGRRFGGTDDTGVCLKCLRDIR